MYRQVIRSICVLSCVVWVSCSGPGSRTFDVRTIDTDEQPVPCVIVLDDNYDAAQEKPALTPNKVRLEYKDNETVKLSVKAVEVDDQGKPVGRIPGQYDPSPFFVRSRDIYATDPKIILFILRRDPDYAAR